MRLDGHRIVALALMAFACGLVIGATAERWKLQAESQRGVIALHEGAVLKNVGISNATVDWLDDTHEATVTGVQFETPHENGWCIGWHSSNCAISVPAAVPIGP